MRARRTHIVEMLISYIVCIALLMLADLLLQFPAGLFFAVLLAIGSLLSLFNGCAEIWCLYTYDQDQLEDYLLYRREHK